LKFYLRGLPEWVFVEAATRISRERPERMLNKRELATFQRNIETIIELAIARQIKVVLTTMPYTTEEYSESIVYIKARPYIKQYNEVMRAIAKKYEPLLFVDLDKLMTGKMNQHFVDVGHLDDDGKRIKAEHIGKLIAEDLRHSGISIQ
jgi:lysophospholipase L1-like esterase